MLIKQTLLSWIERLTTNQKVGKVHRPVLKPRKVASKTQSHQPQAISNPQSLTPKPRRQTAP
jgi:hypothetical protein